MDINVKYFDEKMARLVKKEKGDWIDLSVVNAFVCENNDVDIKHAIKTRSVDPWRHRFDGKDRLYFKRGEVIVMRLGVGVKLPANKKAQVLSRSSTFPSYGLLLTNSVGAIDNKYSGNEDEWLAIYYATRDGYITKYDRICQFDIVDRMEVTIHEVLELDDESRGGHGTSGKQ